MIQLAFITGQRKIIKFHIIGNKVIYFDDMWKLGIQILPKDQNLIERLTRSGKPSLRIMAALILDANKGDDFKEYQSCKNEEDIAAFIRKDCKSKGLLEAK